MRPGRGPLHRRGATDGGGTAARRPRARGLTLLDLAVVDDGRGQGRVPTTIPLQVGRGTIIKAGVTVVVLANPSTWGTWAVTRPGIGRIIGHPSGYAPPEFAPERS